MMKLLRPFGQLLLFLSLVTVPLTAQALEEMPYGQGLLWKVERAGQEPSYVFGTIHLGDDEILDLPEPVEKAFAKSRSASFELVFDEQSLARLFHAARYPHWQTLDEVLGPELYTDVVLTAERMGLTVHQVRRLRPWVILLELGRQPLPYSPDRSSETFLDAWLQERAEDDGKKVYALETVDEQVDVFDDLPDDTQRRLVRYLIENVADDGADREEKFTEMVRLYLARDVSGIFALYSSEEELAQDEVARELSQIMSERMLNQRNHTMVRRMEPRLKEGAAFIAVGAGHLPGEEGVLNLLAQDGYTLSRIY